MPEDYIHKFSKLRTDRGPNRYPEVTFHRAPHKPFLLLSVIDLIAQGVITRNFIEISWELVDTFNTYWFALMPAGREPTMAYPFSRLQTDGFWHRVPKDGYRADIEYNVKSVRRLREIYEGARLDDELFQLLCTLESREQLRAVLIDTYFVPEIRPIIAQQGSVNYEAYEYSKKLLELAEKQKEYAETGKAGNQQVRNQGFRKAIVSLYDHRCALCGIRMLTADGHTVVEAAHVIPWNLKPDDRPTNGMALCRLCHWSFDEGLMSVGRDYEVMVSRQVRVDRNIPGHVMTLADRPIFTPEEEVFWPHQQNLDWHRKHTFQR
jgi:putative restriction endonuclease